MGVFFTMLCSGTNFAAGCCEIGMSVSMLLF
jgi:hypothetical protein